MTKKISSKKKKNSFLNKMFATITNVLTIATLLMFFILNILPIKYFAIVGGLLLLIDVIITILLLKKRKNKKGTMIISFVFCLALSLVLYYGCSTLGFLNNFGKNSYKQEDYSLVVLKSSSYDDVDDLNGKKIGVVSSDNEGQKRAIKKLKTKISFSEVQYDDSGSLTNDLLNKKIEGMYIESAQLEINYEMYPELKGLTNIIYNTSVKIKNGTKTSKIDITKDPFNVYVSGIDTYGSVNRVSRSDVNIVLSINPQNHKILITSIPRDYYVAISGKTGLKDKLTHAGIYGVETSMKTLADLLETPIDYYVKVNFSSLVKMVDTLDGLDVNSNYSFTTIDGYSFNKGINHLNGKQALSFVRERHAFDSLGGDRVRGENQQLVLSAMIKKAMSPKILTKYNSLLKNLSTSFVTNINNKDITSLINQQLADNVDWSIETMNLDGSNSYQYTYSYQSQKLYVMIPDEDSVNNAIRRIDLISD